ncbi:hypothetical protein [Comamonas sp.]|uniref:hypothetical protein n=1 Tax=Comamonas sp. TaxID=34028 RepID=UPI0028A05C26|nr:hypothetical protein [Comamonas sp.]
MQWLLKLLPAQKMQKVGNGNVQAGRVDGGLHHSHHTTHNIHNTFFVMGAQTSASSVPDTGPPDFKQPPSAAKTKAEIKDYQRALLRLLMNHHTYEGTALRFCQREFGTDRIKRLNEQQCRRVTRYVEECMRRDMEKMAVENR